MTYQLTEDQQMIAATARAFADDKLKPNAARWDEEKRLDRPTLQAMAALGFASIYIKEDTGGAGLGRLEAALIFEELSRGCVSTAAFMSIHNMSTWMIDMFGDDELRQRFVPRLTRMDAIGSYCLTEPSSGSDAAALRTSAR